MQRNLWQPSGTLWPATVNSRLRRQIHRLLPAVRVHDFSDNLSDPSFVARHR